MQPHHKHDCERCVFLGQVHPHSLTGPSDVYAHVRETRPDAIIIRKGPHGHQYESYNADAMTRNATLWEPHEQAALALYTSWKDTDHEAR